MTTTTDGFSKQKFSLMSLTILFIGWIWKLFRLWIIKAFTSFKERLNGYQSSSIEEGWYKWTICTVGLNFRGKNINKCPRNHSCDIVAAVFALVLKICLRKKLKNFGLMVLTEKSLR